MEPALAHHEKVASRLREDALHVDEVGEGLGEEHQVQLLHLSLVGLEAGGDDRLQVDNRAARQRQGLVGLGGDALAARQQQRREGHFLGAVDRLVKVRAHRAGEDRVEARAVAVGHKPVSELAAALVGPHLEQPVGRAAQLVAKQPERPLRQVARSEQVVALLVHRELAPHSFEDVNHARGQLLRRAEA
eukprot:6196860-Pleurochrysis_carterae.AAC.3